MDSLITIGRHQIKILHSREKVEITISAPPSACVIECVKRSVTIKVLSIFFDNGGPYIFIERRYICPNQRLIKNLSEVLVPLFI
jgi:hypothetical protein